MRPRLAYGVCVQRRTTQLLQCRQSDQLSRMVRSMPRVLVWATHLALPLAGLWLLLAQPRRRPDLAAPRQPLLAGAGGRRGQRRARRPDERRRAPPAATPGCSSSRWRSWPAPASCCCTRWPRPESSSHHPNAGFDLAQPVGLTMASVFARGVVPAAAGPASRLHGTARPAGRSLAARAGRLGVGVAAGPAAAEPADPGRATSRARWSSPRSPRSRCTSSPRCGSTCCTAARRRAMLISLVTAFALLAEAMVAVTLADKWQLSWWEWHCPADAGVRLRRLQRLRAVPARGLQRRPLRRDRPGRRDHPPDPGRVRDGAGGARHRAAGARAHRRRPERLGWRRGWRERFGLTEGRRRCSTGPAPRWPPSGT